MADWQEGAHACIIALVFAVMLAKLLSLLAAFNSGNLRLQRTPCSEDTEASLRTDAPLETTEHNVLHGDFDFSDVDADSEANDCLDFETNPDLVCTDHRGGSEAGLEVESEREPMQGESTEGELKHIAEGENVAKEAERPVEYESDDWEGVESTELEEEFGAASTFVAAMGTSSGFKTSQELQLQLYALYKVATEGPCRTPQPSLINVTARAKWGPFLVACARNAWQKLGNTSPEEAMVRYIYLLSKMSPNWNRGAEKSAGKGGSNLPQSGGVGGPVFSTFMSEEGSGEAGSFEAIHASAKSGDRVGLLRLLEQGETVDQTDSQGRTALHWAVDHGHLGIVEFLLLRGAEIDAKDQEGQTALHYATICEHENVAKHLVEQGADPFMIDNDGVTPNRLRPQHWDWMARKGGSQQ